MMLGVYRWGTLVGWLLVVVGFILTLSSCKVPSLGVGHSAERKDSPSSHCTIIIADPITVARYVFDLEARLTECERGYPEPGTEGGP